MNDKELARRLKKHDQNALTEIINEYTGYVGAIAANIAGDKLTKSDMEEIVTDVFVTLWRNSEKLKADSLKAYISCIAKSRTKDRLRREKGGEIYSIDDFDEPDNSENSKVDENFENKEMFGALKQEIDKLGEPDREIIIRYYYYYQKTADIASALNIKVETIKTKLQRSRAKLKTALIERGY